jgi:hypothetical protein
VRAYHHRVLSILFHIEHRVVTSSDKGEVYNQVNIPPTRDKPDHSITVKTDEMPSRPQSKPKRSFMAVLIKAMTDLENHKQYRAPPTVNRQPSKPVPAEKPWESYDFIAAGIEDPVLRVLQQHGDGLWLCCCGHENTLVHYRGAFPFRYLRCGRCSHILCSKCHTTDILTHDPSGVMKAPVCFSLTTGDDVRYCRVCRTCGLSHRAEIYGGKFIDLSRTLCRCGHPSDGVQTHYYIGTVNGWRCDPAGNIEALIEQRRSMKYQRRAG